MVFLCPFFTVLQIGICIKILKMDNTDFQSNERSAGNKAAAALRGAFRSTIRSNFHRRSGDMEDKSTVTPKYKEGVLDRLSLVSPYYSFTSHFGSTKTGTTGSLQRGDADVKSFTRHVAGTDVDVKAHKRSGGFVVSHRKGIDYKAKNHISEALKSTNALEVLATELGENRIVNIISQIDF